MKPNFDKLMQLMDLQDSFNLVPDRWSKSGWKYAPGDPAMTKYFNNPNTVNRIGASPTRYSAFDERDSKVDKKETYRNMLDTALPKIVEDAVAQSNNTFRTSYHEQFNETATPHKYNLWHKKVPSSFVKDILPPHPKKDKNVIVWGGKIHQ